MKKERICIALALLGHISTGQDLSLNVLKNQSSVNIFANPTQNERVYSLLQSQDLSSWTETSSSRGNGSNLVFEVSDSGFYKVRGDYQPVSPLEIDVQYPHQPHQDYPTTRNIGIFNYSTNNLRAVLTYTETFNPYGLTYTTDMPKTNLLITGDNITSTTCYWAWRSGTGGNVGGKINIKILENE